MGEAKRRKAIDPNYGKSSTSNRIVECIQELLDYCPGTANSFVLMLGMSLNQDKPGIFSNIFTTRDLRKVNFIPLEKIASQKIKSFLENVKDFNREKAFYFQDIDRKELAVIIPKDDIEEILNKLKNVN